MTKKKEKEDTVKANQEDKIINQNQTVDENLTGSDETRKKLSCEELLIQSQEYFEGWQRERADFMNYKKRIERDQLSMKNYQTGEIIKKFLVVIDDMELAIKNKPAESNCSDWLDGIDLIYQKLITILESEGVERIATDGEFDPTVHEALTLIESPAHASGQIVDVMRQGYKIGERVLRPSLVIIAR